MIRRRALHGMSWARGKASEGKNVNVSAERMSMCLRNVFKECQCVGGTSLKMQMCQRNGGRGARLAEPPEARRRPPAAGAPRRRRRGHGLGGGLWPPHPHTPPPGGFLMWPARLRREGHPDEPVRASKRALLERPQDAEKRPFGCLPRPFGAPGRGAAGAAPKASPDGTPSYALGGAGLGRPGRPAAAAGPRVPCTVRGKARPPVAARAPS